MILFSFLLPTIICLILIILMHYAHIKLEESKNRHTNHGEFVLLYIISLIPIIGFIPVIMFYDSGDFYSPEQYLDFYFNTTYVDLDIRNELKKIDQNIEDLKRQRKSLKDKAKFRNKLKKLGITESNKEEIKKILGL